MAEGFVVVVMSGGHVLQKENPQGTLCLGRQLIRGITSICWESMLTPIFLSAPFLCSLMPGPTGFHCLHPEDTPSEGRLI